MPSLIVRGRMAAAASLLLITASAELLASDRVDPPVDSGGRPVLDANGAPLLYTDPAPEQAQPARAGAMQAVTGDAAAAAVTPAAEPAWVEQWRTKVWGTGIGNSGILPVDEDGDGKLEFVVSTGGAGFGGNQGWSIVRYDADTAGYQLVWQSPAYPGDDWSVPGVTALALGSSIDPGHRNVWVGRSDGKIDVFDLQTRTLLKTIDTGDASPITALVQSDADNSGAPDMVVLTQTHLRLYRPQRFTLTRTLDQGATAMAVGDVTADSKREIVLSTGKVLRLTPESTTLVWDRGQAFGSYVALGQLDADARLELVSAEAWYYLRAWDLDIRSPKWEVPTDQDIDALLVQDVTGDSRSEIIYGDGQWGGVHVLGSTGSELRYIANPEHGITRIAVFDADADNKAELMFGAGYSSTGPDYLFVHEYASGNREWTSTDESAPFMADIGDVDNDDSAELVVASFESESGYDDGLVSVYDAGTGALRWRTAPSFFGGHAWTGLHDVRIANIDSDPQAEILVTTDRLYDGRLYIIDGSTHALQKTVVLDVGAPLYAMELHDIDGDGKLEVISGAGRAHTGASGTYLYVINPRTGTARWRSVSLTTGWSGTSDVHATTFGTGSTWLVAVNERVNRIRWSDRQHLQSIAADYLSAITLDVEGGTQPEILAGALDGRIDVLSGGALAVLDTHEVCSGPIRALQHMGGQKIVLACGDELIEYDLAARAITSSSPTDVASFGMNGSLRIHQADGATVLLLGGYAATLWKGAAVPE